jgi:hypothetical protein
VAKTFMYSQLNYIGCFLPLEQNWIDLFENLIENYVKGNLNISKERMTLQREEGGLGLFSICNFLGSQACTWAKRAQNLDDHWKQRLYSKSLGSTLNLRAKFFNKAEEPILHNIALHMERMSFRLTEKKAIFWIPLYSTTRPFFMAGKIVDCLMIPFSANKTSGKTGTK